MGQPSLCRCFLAASVPARVQVSPARLRGATEEATYAFATPAPQAGGDKTPHVATANCGCRSPYRRYRCKARGAPCHDSASCESACADVDGGYESAPAMHTSQGESSSRLGSGLQKPGRGPGCPQTATRRREGIAARRGSSPKSGGHACCPCNPSHHSPQHCPHPPSGTVGGQHVAKRGSAHPCFGAYHGKAVEPSQCHCCSGHTIHLAGGQQDRRRRGSETRAGDTAARATHIAGKSPHPNRFHPGIGRCCVSPRLGQSGRRRHGHAGLMPLCQGRGLLLIALCQGWGHVQLFFCCPPPCGWCESQLSQRLSGPPAAWLCVPGCQGGAGGTPGVPPCNRVW